MLRKFLRQVLGISLRLRLYIRCSVLDLPTGGSRVLCTCTAAGRHCVAVHVRVRMCMREELPSLELLLV